MTLLQLKHPEAPPGKRGPAAGSLLRKLLEARALRLILVGMSLAVALPAGIIASRAARAAQRLLHLPRKRVTPALVSQFGPALREAEFKTADGLTLRGWYLPSRNGSAVLMMHGVGENRTRFVQDAKLVAAQGCGALLFDFRGNGESDGNTVTWGDAERRDYQAAMAFLVAQPGVEPKRIGVIGFSMGAAVAAQMVTDQTPAALVLEGCSATLQDDIRDSFHRWGPLSEWPAIWTYQAAGVKVSDVQPIRAIAAMRPRPLFIIQGDEELRAAGHSVDPMLAVAPKPREYWQVPGARHGEYSQVAGAEYSRRISKFFQRSLLKYAGETPR